ncbi:hypothetical protein PTKIN_Ptkin03bG0129500 [Pterospermum kingtungense]
MILMMKLWWKIPNRMEIHDERDHRFLFIFESQKDKAKVEKIARVVGGKLGCCLAFHNGRNEWVEFQYEMLHDFCYIFGYLDHQDKDCDMEIQLKMENKDVVNQFGPGLRANERIAKEVVWMRKKILNQRWKLMRISHADYNEYHCMKLSRVQGPSCSYGVLCSGELWDGGVKPRRLMENFANSLQDCGLIEIPVDGPFFTWSKDHMPLVFIVVAFCEKMVSKVKEVQSVSSVVSSLSECGEELKKWDERLFDHLQSQIKVEKKKIKRLL